MNKNTLLLISHPNFSKSKINKALVDIARKKTHVIIRHLDEIQKNNTYPMEEEIALLKSASSIIWQFPIYWYSAPASLRNWQDQILSPIVYGPDNFLKGKKLRVVCSAGASEDTFSPTGLNRFTIEQMLCPMQMTANASLMIWQKPFVTYGASSISEEQMKKIEEEYSSLL